VVSLNLRRRHLNESQRAMVAARIANLPAHRPAASPPIGGLIEPPVPRRNRSSYPRRNRHRRGNGEVDGAVGALYFHIMTKRTITLPSFASLLGRAPMPEPRKAAHPKPFPQLQTAQRGRRAANSGSIAGRGSEPTSKPLSPAPMNFGHLRPTPNSDAPTAPTTAPVTARAIVAAARRASAPIEPSPPAKGTLADKILRAGARARRPTGDGEPAAVRIAREASR